jgi:endonuclease YncB( thermonuclease family)
MADDRRTMQAAYLEGLPRGLLSAALAPPPVPAPIRMNGIVVDHHDGDTFYVRMSIGVYDLEVARQSIRLLGGAARELSDPGGKEARDNLKAMPGMTVGSPVVLTADRDSVLQLIEDKYKTRLDAVVTYLGPDKAPHDLVSTLIAQQWLAPWNGSGAQPKPPWPRTV